MQNFSRALRLALRYRLTIAGSLLCSAAIAALWGGNIGALYPLLEVSFSNRSLQDWIDEEITSSRVKIVEIEKSIVALRQQQDSDSGERELTFEMSRLQAERRALATSLRLKPFVDRYMPSQPFHTVMLIVLVLLVSTAIKGACIVIHMLLSASLFERVNYDLRRQLFHHVLKSDMQQVGREGTSKLMTHFQADISQVSSGVSFLFGQAVREPLKAIACLIGASLICWRLLVLSLLIAPLAAFLMRRLAVSIKRANRRMLEEITTMNHVIYETFSGMPTVQAFTMERSERGRFRRVARECIHKAMKIVFYNALTKPLTELLGIGIICLALTAGAYLVLNQQTHLFGIKICERPISMPAMLVFYGLLIGVSDPARKLSEMFNSIQSAVAAADRLYPILDQKSRIIDPPQASPIPPLRRRLLLDHVNFHYEAGQPVLRDINLEIRAGETVAIVGPNGCGKSTLVNLLLRFHDPVDGAVRWDDVDLRDVRVRDLRRRVGLVTQQNAMFNDTVLNNVRYGSPHATEAEVVAAAKQAHADRFIVEKLTDGYQTVVGQGGSRLSGGQRQRIALARAILRDPEILILDEATSQIDIESEQLIHKALADFARDRTAIMITHRLSTLTLADRVVVMEAGRVIDVGSHDELLGRCQLYARLHDIHFKRSA